MEYRPVLTKVELPQRQRKPATYGKSGRNTSYALQKDDFGLLSPPRTNTSRQHSPPTRALDPLKASSGKLVRPSPRKPAQNALSIFDVPSSDDESGGSGSGSPTQEHDRTKGHNKAKDGTVKRSGSQPRQDVLSDSSTASHKRKRPTPTTPPPPPNHVPTIAQESKPKPQPAAKPAVPRPIAHKPVPAASQNKTIPAGLKSPRTIIPPISRKRDNATSSSQTAQQRKVVQRSVPKSVSAPTTLRSMVEEKVYDVPGDVEKDTVQYDLPSTPPRSQGSPMSISTPQNTSKKDTSNARGKMPMTPRQNQLWSRLLDEADAGTESPSALEVDQLSIKDNQPRSTFKPPALLKSQSDTATTGNKRRKRLIDTLKQSRPVEEDEESDSEDSETSTSGVEEKSPPPPTSNDQKGVSHESATQQHSQESSQAMRLAKSSGPKITYASQRTYLASNSLEADLELFDMPLDMPIGLPSQNKWGGASHSKPSHSQSMFEDEDLDDSQVMRSARELRLAGMATGVSLEIQNWLDDISGRNGSSISGKRSALFELCAKLADEEVIARLVESGMDQTFVRAWAEATDVIIQFCTAIAINFLAASKRVLTETCQEMARAAILPILSRLVGNDTDINRIVKDRKTNMSKVAQKSCQEFCANMQPKLWPEDPPRVLSPRAVALKALETLTRRLRADGVADTLLSDELIAQLLRIVASSVTPSANKAPNDTKNAEIALSVLEAGSISSPSSHSTSWSPASLSTLSTMLSPLLSLPSASGSRIQILALKLTLNLTNNNPAICDLFATPALVRHLIDSMVSRFRTVTDSTLPEEQRDMQRDTLLLSLGAMFNLAECSETARGAVVADGEALVDALVRCFLEGRTRTDEADSVEASQIAVAYGYLAVLLGNLCLDRAVRTAAAARLPGGELGTLVDAMDRFIAYHQKVDSEAFEGEEGAEVYASFTGRLRAVVERLKSEAA